MISILKELIEAVDAILEERPEIYEAGTGLDPALERAERAAESAKGFLESHQDLVGIILLESRMLEYGLKVDCEFVAVGGRWNVERACFE